MASVLLGCQLGNPANKFQATVLLSDTGRLYTWRGARGKPGRCSAEGPYGTHPVHRGIHFLRRALQKAAAAGYTQPMAGPAIASLTEAEHGLTARELARAWLDQVPPEPAGPDELDHAARGFLTYLALPVPPAPGERRAYSTPPPRPDTELLRRLLHGDTIRHRPDDGAGFIVTRAGIWITERATTVPIDHDTARHLHTALGAWLRLNHATDTTSD
ncbi:MAG: hypothetical protein HOU01_11625 [Streptomycetaceae bacterium]|nr:hypothetical protein [Streptomycetaceae bacterium]